MAKIVEKHRASRQEQSYQQRQ